MLENVLSLLTLCERGKRCLAECLSSSLFCTMKEDGEWGRKAQHKNAKKKVPTGMAIHIFSMFWETGD